MKRELSLYAFAGNNSADGERLFDSATGTGNDGSGEDLNSFLGSFQDLGVYVDRITDFEFGRIFFHAGFGNQVQQFLLIHDFKSLCYEKTQLSGSASLPVFVSNRSPRRSLVRAKLCSCLHCAMRG